MKPLATFVLILGFLALASFVLMGCTSPPPVETPAECDEETGEGCEVDEGAEDGGDTGATGGTGGTGGTTGTGGTGGTGGTTGTGGTVTPGGDECDEESGEECGEETGGEETGGEECDPEIEDCEPVVCDEETGEGCEECDPETEECEPEWGDECWEDDDCEFSDDRCIYGFCETPRCARLSECPTGTEFCFDGECVMKEDIYGMFEACASVPPECEESCENCVVEKYRCVTSGQGDLSYRICVQCAVNDDCNDGFVCVHHECVAPPEE